MNLSLLLAILRKEELEDSVCIDFSNICYSPGVIGMTMKENNYIVYEIDEFGVYNETLSTSKENEACLGLLNSLGIVFD